MMKECVIYSEKTDDNNKCERSFTRILNRLLKFAMNFIYKFYIYYQNFT